MKKDNIDAKIGLAFACIMLIAALGLIWYAVAEHNRIYGPPVQNQSKE